MGTPSLPENQSLLLTPCSSVHSFFMRYPIDVIFLDEENRVLRILHSLRPFRFGPLVRGAKVALELPAGRCTSSSTRVGDLIKFT
ncbi:MAG: DUF192 domain-containing protein [Firmicutes bacterium]|nr:DUF192 domain-containing protein [Bacillota bacterium]